MATQTLPEKPHQQRKLSFSKRSFGKKQVIQRSIKPTWFEKWEWLHYDESADAAFCHVFTKAEEGNLNHTQRIWCYFKRGFPIGRMPSRDSIVMSWVNAHQGVYNSGCKYLWILINLPQIPCMCKHLTINRITLESTPTSLHCQTCSVSTILILSNKRLKIRRMYGCQGQAKYENKVVKIIQHHSHITTLT